MRAHSTRQRVIVAGRFLVVGLGIVAWSLASFRALVSRDVTFFCG